MFGNNHKENLDGEKKPVLKKACFKSVSLLLVGGLCIYWMLKQDVFLLQRKQCF